MGHSQSFVSRVRVWFVCLCVKHFLDLVFFFFSFLIDPSIYKYHPICCMRSRRKFCQRPAVEGIDMMMDVRVKKKKKKRDRKSRRAGL